MSGYEPRPGDVTIYKERDKKSDKAPDWKGYLILPEDFKAGDKLELSLWAKGSYGTMLGGKVKAQFKPGEGFSGPAGRASDPVAPKGFDDPFGDSVPF